MSTTRERVGDRMALEIHEYLARTLSPGIGGHEEAWEQTAEAAAELMGALRAWERGEISYTDLEAAGTRYVEAWGEVDAAFRAVRETAA